MTTTALEDHRHNKDGFYYIKDGEGDTYEINYCTICGIDPIDLDFGDENEENKNG